MSRLPTNPEKKFSLLTQPWKEIKSPKPTALLRMYNFPAWDFNKSSIYFNSSKEYPRQYSSSIFIDGFSLVEPTHEKG